MNGLFRLSIRLFKLFGVTVFLHWSWLVVAIIQISLSHQNGLDQPLLFHVALYLSLFLIVLMHEFGHAMACRSVGGVAEQIVLWPLGGVAYVQPPPRPGPILWSIAAGPLVNVALVPVTVLLWLLFAHLQGPDASVTVFFRVVTFINGGLLVFNLLPIYPLDGGQMLRSLLWFAVGRAISLLMVSILGLLGGLAFLLFGVLAAGFWIALMGGFILMQSYVSLRLGWMLYRLEGLPRHVGPVCPSCHEAPPAGALWSCACGASFDTFENGGRCPQCGELFAITLCPLCRHGAPLPQWYVPEMSVAPTLDRVTVPPVLMPQESGR